MFTNRSKTAVTTDLRAGQKPTPFSHLRGVGYVRVSTDKQAQEGVSLEAQREKLMQYCSLYGIELIAVHIDDGYTAKSLKRPGLSAALWKLDRGEADALIVCKLDRLTRSLPDLNNLITHYFTSEQHSLLSVSESLDTRTPMGRFVLYILGIVAQWEREAISERTREALAHLKTQGVYIGCVEYGKCRIPETDEQGRRRIVVDDDAQKIIAEILQCFDQGMSGHAICEMLNRRQVPSPRRRQWQSHTVLNILERNGRQARRPRPKREYQPERARQIARRLREDDRSLRFIAKRLDAMGLKPVLGGRWHASTVDTLLKSEVATDVEACRRRAQQLRKEERLSLRAIGSQLEKEGYQPPRAGRWHAATVSALLS